MKKIGMGFIIFGMVVLPSLVCASLQSQQTGDSAQEKPSAKIEEIKQKAEAGEASALFILGRMYTTGRGVERNYKQAAEWFRKAGDQGNVDAKIYLGSMYYQGQGVEQDYKQSAQWFRKAAEQGDAGAQFNLGMMYNDGQGVEKDFKQGAQWLRKAAEQGHSGAQFNLASMYHTGQGVEKDTIQEAKWFLKASNQGIAPAQLYVGLMYMVGKGVEKNYVEAYKWTLIARKGGVDVGKQQAFLERLLTPPQIQEAQRLAKEFVPKVEWRGLLETVSPKVEGTVQPDVIRPKDLKSNRTGLSIGNFVKVIGVLGVIAITLAIAWVFIVPRPRSETAPKEIPIGLEMYATLSRTIRVWWALLWRSLIINFVLGISLVIAMGFVIGRNKSPNEYAFIRYPTVVLFNFLSSFIAVGMVLGKKIGNFCLVLIEPLSKIASSDQTINPCIELPAIIPEDPSQNNGLIPEASTPCSTGHETILDITFERILRVWWAYLWRSMILCVASSFALGFGMSFSKGFMVQGLTDSVPPIVLFSITGIVTLVSTLVAIWMILGMDFGTFRLILVPSHDEQPDQPSALSTNHQIEPEPVIEPSGMTIPQPTPKDSLPVRCFRWDNCIHLILLTSIFVGSGIGCYFIKDLAPLGIVGFGILLLMMLDSIRFIKQLGSFILPGGFVSIFVILGIAISVFMVIPEEESSPGVMNVILIGSGIGFIVLLMCSSMGFYCCSELNIQRSYFPKLIFSETEGYPNIFHSVLIVLLFSGCAILYTYVVFKTTSPKMAKELIQILKVDTSTIKYDFNKALNFIPLYVSLAFLEEIIYRLGIQNYLAHVFNLRGRRYWYAVIITSLLWTLAHSYTLDPTWVKYVQVFPMGIALGFMFKKYGIECCMLAHGSMNALVVLSSKYIQANI